MFIIKQLDYMRIFYFYLAYFTFSMSYSELPFHLVCFPISPSLLFYVLYQAFIKYSGKAFVYIYAAKSLQSCPTLCDPMDCSLPGFSVHGILQARTLEWGAIAFSNAWKWKVKVKSLSRVQLCATPWTAAYQAPSSVGFSGQQYWSGVPLPSPTG